jgi:predicted PurR-regulated permease PerM
MSVQSYRTSGVRAVRTDPILQSMATTLQQTRAEQTAAAQTPPAPEAPPLPLVATGRHALTLLAVLAAIGSLKFAQQAVVPVLFAVFLALLLSPAVEVLVRRRMPRVLAAVLVMTVLLALVAALLSVTWRPARAWLETAPVTLRQLERKLRPVTRFIAKVESVSTQAERMTETAGSEADRPQPVALDPKGFLQSTQEWVVALVSMVFLTLFLLATDLPALERRGAGTAWARAGPLVERVRGELGRYFAAVTISNLLLGLGTAVAMALLDMPNPALWGVIAFSLNFIPYAGSAVTLMLLTAVALVSFPGIGKAIYVAGTYLLLTTLEGQVLQPVLVGRRLDISPPVVLLGLWFGGWLWGVPGVALAMPLLVSAKAAAQEIARSRAGDARADADTVRTRASAWLRESSQRYRRPRRPG